jgi:DNA-binding NtrC family response regulator
VEATGRRLSELERAEVKTILQAMQKADGNKHKAAEALGIARSTLYRKIRSLSIDLDVANF